MRKNAIIRIVLWSIVLLLLLGILFSMFMINGRFRHRRAGSSDPANAEISTPSSEFSPESIRELEIEWISGKILIQLDDSANTIRISETGVSDIKNQLVCRHGGDTLSIQFCRESISFSSFGLSFNGNLNKDLTILVPSDWLCEALEIDAASADLEIRDLTIHNVDFDGASGTCDFKNCTVENLDMDTASGDVRFQGFLNTLDFDAASASFYGELINTPSRIDMDGASGDLELVLPSDTGFSVSMDGLSCDFSSDFPTHQKNRNYVYGDGRCQITMDGMSGDVILREAQ